MIGHLIEMDNMKRDINDCMNENENENVIVDNEIASQENEGYSVGKVLERLICLYCDKKFHWQRRKGMRESSCEYWYSMDKDTTIS